MEVVGFSVHDGVIVDGRGVLRKKRLGEAVASLDDDFRTTSLCNVERISSAILHLHF